MTNPTLDYSFTDTNQSDFQRSDDIIEILEAIPGVDDDKAVRDADNGNANTASGWPV
jgi:hypothetical protein